MDGGNSSSNTINAGGPDVGRGGFKKREFDTKQSDVRLTGSLMESSNSLQSQVESIDDDHVFKLTEMTKKRVEHNNPAQKRQRVVSLPISETSQANFQPSEHTLQFSSSCKAYLESKYTLLYQSVNTGHPINRLRRLHEILPQIHKTSIPRPVHDGKTSMDSTLPRSRWLKHDKYRFVDKVKESSCIWNVDHMEIKAATLAAVEAARVAKQSAEPSSRHGSQNNLAQTGTSSSKSSSHQHLPSTSAEDIGVEGPIPRDLCMPPKIITNQLYHDSPLAVVDAQNIPMGMSPSSTFSSIASPTQSSSTMDPNTQKRQPKENSGESRLRFVEPYSPTPKSTSGPTFKFNDEGGKNNNGNLESPNIGGLPSKRNSIFGIFGARGKKVGQDSDQSNHHESPQFSSYGSPQLGATVPAQERQSFDSQLNSHFPPSIITVQTQQNQPPPLVSYPSMHTADSNSSELQSKLRTSFDEAMRASKYNEVGGPTLTDDDNGGYLTSASQWPQGERMEESQDESDNPASAADKRSSIRRFADRMTRKRGQKALSTIQQHDSFQSSPTNPTQGKPVLLDGTKSLGKKVDPSLAHLHEQFSVRATTSEPSSGRSSVDGPSRPKALMSPDGTAGISSPRFGPITDAAVRMDKSPIAYPVKSDKSPLANPVSWMDKSPMVAPTVGTGENQAMCTDLQLLVDVDRIPKRLLERLKLRPELSSIDWSEDTGILMWSSAEPIPTYDEYLGISSDMKTSKLYPSHLNDIDVMKIHLTLGLDELKDSSAKIRAPKWDDLEHRLDQEIVKGEKWIKEITEWSMKKSISIEKHKRQDTNQEGDDGIRLLDESLPLVEEPEAEDEIERGEDGSMANTISNATKTTPATSEHTRNMLKPYTAPRETSGTRRQQRELSLLSVRDLNASGSSMSLPHHNSTSVTYTFKASLESTREAVKEMRVYLVECRERLAQLNGATQLLKKEPIFKDVVDKFTRDWNDSYFVKLKEVEDQIQVMNLKRIENPWMDMLLIMLSWLIRGLFYIVEGVTIMIIIVRHTWGKVKTGYEVIRNTKLEQRRVDHGGNIEGAPGLTKSML
ncbi:hypothetical protein BGX27_006459 [Mortierella sp. AM989]|nr:hypothetical protein BGX27_006459 [Mortierella sp. AM989]